MIRMYVVCCSPTRMGGKSSPASGTSSAEARTRIKYSPGGSGRRSNPVGILCLREMQAPEEELRSRQTQTPNRTTGVWAARGPGAHPLLKKRFRGLSLYTDICVSSRPGSHILGDLCNSVRGIGRRTTDPDDVLAGREAF